ncbi:hypothetical protein BDY21DRAFT_373229 [Lineolata rhizophorae]|uniref:Uncharacterized protein n=1 Tax=Lineolata rhizophorae TaxID=578093 RepID=A0A6A6NV51_9PEZI|nr:hypothetical protein BDY21DRAFT_373229 [Lineolata rhizophorae]
MAIPHIFVHGIRRYSHHAPQDPHFRLKVVGMTGYLAGAFALPFVPPLLETRRSRRDGTDITRPPPNFIPCPKY